MESRNIVHSDIGAKQATIFSSVDFCRVWAEVYSRRWQRINSHGDLGAIYKSRTVLGLREYELSPYGLYWGSEDDDAQLFKQFVDLVAALSRKLNCLSLTWNFRYDSHDEMTLARDELGAANCTVTQHDTHVLDLSGENYERLLVEKMKSVTRQQITYGKRSGLTIRKICTTYDFDQHGSIYLAWAKAKNIKPKPLTLFRKIAIELEQSASLIGAFLDKKLIAAILVFHDDLEWFYWHGVRDPNFDRMFAIDVLLNHVTQDAFNRKVRYFNMGGSAGIKSLEFFKERWGAKKKSVWCIQWYNPFWKKTAQLRKGTIFNIMDS